jgi:hypothetical protein
VGKRQMISRMNGALRLSSALHPDLPNSSLVSLLCETAFGTVGWLEARHSSYMVYPRISGIRTRCPSTRSSETGVSQFVSHRAK